MFVIQIGQFPLITLSKFPFFHGSWRIRKVFFSEIFFFNFDLKHFRSDSFSIRTSCIECSLFRARVAKGRPGLRLPRSHFKGKPRVKNRISKGSCGLRKPKKYLRLIMIRVAWNMNKSSFQKKFYLIFEKILTSKMLRNTEKIFSA